METVNKIGRALLEWLNKCPYLPVNRINFEFLPDEAPSMMMSTIQSEKIVRQYILGGYEAQYQFKLVYRVKPDDNDSRFSADEALDAIGMWAEKSKEKPDIENAVVRSVDVASNASLLAVYSDGSRDHQILMNLTYEVN